MVLKGTVWWIWTNVQMSVATTTIKRQNISITPDLLLPLFGPSPPSPPACWFTHFPSLESPWACSRISYKRNQTAGTLLCLCDDFRLTILLPVCCVVYVCSFRRFWVIFVSSFLYYFTVCFYHNLFPHSPALMVIRVALSVWSLRAFMYKS